MAGTRQGGLTMCKSEVLERINRALDTLVERDEKLFISGVNERTLCHRLAVYLEWFFKGYDVDCEYNRVDGIDPKRIHIVRSDIKEKIKGFNQNNGNDDVARTAYPDIIVHKRDTNNMNLLVIEIKKDSNKDGDEIDFYKLRAYKEEFNYEHAVFIKLLVGELNENQGRYEEPKFIDNN